MRIKCAQKTTKGCLLAPPKVCCSCDSLQPFRKQYPVKHTAVKHFFKIYIFKGCKYIFYFASILIPKYLFIFFFSFFILFYFFNFFGINDNLANLKTIIWEFSISFFVVGGQKEGRERIQFIDYSLSCLNISHKVFGTE